MNIFYNIRAQRIFCVLFQTLITCISRITYEKKEIQWLIIVFNNVICAGSKFQILIFMKMKRKSIALFSRQNLF